MADTASPSPRRGLLYIADGHVIMATLSDVAPTIYWSFSELVSECLCDRAPAVSWACLGIFNSTNRRKSSRKRRDILDLELRLVNEAQEVVLEAEQCLCAFLFTTLNSSISTSLSLFYFGHLAA